MVLLVRCRDNTCSVALTSHLDDLVNEGLVTAYLRNGEWVTVKKSAARRVCASPTQTQAIPLPVAVAV